MATPARIVAAGRGARWLGTGWRLFRAAPLSWIALVFTYYLLMIVVSFIPLVGSAAIWALMPPFSVGFMAASRAAAGRDPVSLEQLFSGFRAGLRGQLALGGAYVASVALVLAAAVLLAGDPLKQWILAGKLTQDAFGALWIVAALYVPVMMMFWFAPVLVAWHGVTPLKALFFSFVACLLNWRAFLVYGALAILMTMGVSLLALSAKVVVLGSSLVGPGDLIIPMLLVMPTLFASFYVSYRDVFATTEPS
ncbi:MAG TPA: BPSS1780 family membrane protein [Burkholderiales bacterium]|nr:BPSS1780 family membrane protein [Burkholderiales bacterium]